MPGLHQSWPRRPGCADCLLVTCTDRVRAMLSTTVWVLEPYFVQKKVPRLNEMGSASFFLAVRFLFLGRMEKEERKERG